MNSIPLIPIKWSVVSVSGMATSLIALEFTPSVLQVITVLGGVLSALIGAIGLVLVAKVNSNTRVTERAAAVLDKVDANVDGMKSRDSAEIAELRRENLSLRQTVVELKQVAAVLAQAQSQSRPTVVIAQTTPAAAAGPPGPADESDR